MLQDSDPLWHAIQDFLKKFDDSMTIHGGLITREAAHAAEVLRQQLFADRRREAAARRELADLGLESDA